MCGIAGIAGPDASPSKVSAMVEMQAHRGPDASGLYDAGFAVIGQNRLSIIDLVTGDQPMCNEDGSVWLAFNGEIYNYREMRVELESAGHRFKSSSDTEVLVHGYEEWGKELFLKLDGIFAFSIVDVRRKRIMLVRDNFGIKPLHYHFDGKNLLFSSEIKGLLATGMVAREVDPQGLHLFMNLRYIPGQTTLFRNVHRLTPGHWLLFEDGRLSIGCYYETRYEPDYRRPESWFVEGIRERLRSAVLKQMISDVPIGVYLSGGLDSSSIVAFMSEAAEEPVRTYSLGFGEPTDELIDARVVAEHFRTNHYQRILDLKPLRDYPSVIWHVEEPKENILQSFLLARFARQHVKVCHGGLGGDELFAGYTIHRFVYPFQRLHALVPTSFTRALLAKVSRLAFILENGVGRLSWDEYRRGFQMLMSIGDPRRFYLILRNVWDHDPGQHANVYGTWMLDQAREPVEKCFKPYFVGRGAIDDVLWGEFHTKMMDDFLLNEDRTSMAHGLEVRVPFLDRELVRFAWTIPGRMKMQGNETKHLFRKAMAGLLPEHTLVKKKWGFTFDPYYQFQKDLRSTASRILTQKRVNDRGWFNYSYLDRIMKHPPHRKLRWHYFFLWLATGLEIWARMYLDGDNAQPLLDLESHMN
ncbi:MAG: asparagine synthase (glutamine-hydrolyzing) [Desulfofustis sp.]|nr:asparagine synthase (glutamine-hydrolyzing) [Desulfofustis sp.]